MVEKCHRIRKIQGHFSGGMAQGVFREGEFEHALALTGCLTGKRFFIRHYLRDNVIVPWLP